MPTQTRSMQDTHATYVTFTDHGTVWNQPAGTRGTSKSITEYATPGWLDAIMNQDSVVIGSLDRSVWERSQGIGSFHFQHKPFGWDQKIVGDFGALVNYAGQYPHPSPNQGEIARMENLAVIAAKAKASEGATLAGESLAQLEKTVKMLRLPFRSVGQLTRRILRKSERLRAKNPKLIPAKAHADAWLEFNYGWKPLIMEIESIVNAICSYRSQCVQRRLLFRGGAEVTTSTVSPFTGRRLQGSNLDYIEANGCYTVNEHYRANAGVIVDVKPLTPLEYLYKVLGFRCRDLPSTLWALTPFSFVADWFVNVEGWLQAVMPDPKIVYRGSWVTSVSEVATWNDSGTLQGKHPLVAAGSQQGSYGMSVERSVRIRRTPNPSVGTIPMLRSNPMTLAHSLSAASLAIARINCDLEKVRH